jgi:vitamin B12 transporter
MNKKITIVSALFVLSSSFLCAQSIQNDSINSLKEVIVSDTKFAQSKEKSGKVITKISASELEKKSGQSLPMILNSIAGIEINGSQSAIGKNLGYYIRGGKNQQVLILIDGTPVTDASGISIEFDLRLLAIDQIESIEIMKGASSTLYGTGAATAVINITLKKASKKSLKGVINMSIGSNATAVDNKLKGHDFNQSVAVDGRSGALDYLASISSVETTGMSQIAPLANQKNEWDSFSKINLRGKFGIKFSPKLTSSFFGTFDQIKNDYDAPFDNTGFNDTALNFSSTTQVKVGNVSKFNYSNGETLFNASFSNTKRDYSEFNSWTNAIDNSSYASRNAHLDLVNKFQITKNFQFISGVNYQFFDMKSETPYGTISENKTKFNLLDFYATTVWNSNFGLHINSGFRLNTHSQYGLKTIYNINPSYHFGAQKQHKIITSVSTAFVTPSLYQLFSVYGNDALTPEQNQTIELGFESNLFKNKLHFNAVSFYRTQNNSFGFYTNPQTFQSNYVNIEGENSSKGIETELKYSFTTTIKYHFNYTFTEVDEALNRLIPKHKINATVDYSATQKLFLNLSYQYTSARQDVYFDGTTFQSNFTQLKDYQLINFTSTYDWIPNRLSLFLNIQNIFNVDFVENSGYSTRGRNFKLGLNFKF